jgi:hypothetical protein
MDDSQSDTESDGTPPATVPEPAPPIAQAESGDSSSNESAFNLDHSKRKYAKLGKDITRKALLVKKVKSHYEVSDERFNSVLIDDSIPEDILLAAAHGTVVQWAPGCYTTQSRSSTSKKKHKNECNCVLKHLQVNSFEPPYHLCRGFVQAYKKFERDKVLAARAVLNNASPSDRRSLLDLEKQYAEDIGLPAPAWSTKPTSENLLIQKGPTSYNQLVKKCNLITPEERTKRDLPSEGLTPYLDLASKHWRSIIVSKENSKRAYVVLSDEDPDSTEGEGEDNGTLVCVQAFFSFLARLPPNKELTKVYLRFADRVDYLVRLGGRHHFVSRALTYAVFGFKMQQYDKRLSVNKIAWTTVQARFKYNFSQMQLTNDFDLSVGDTSGTISEEQQADADGNIAPKLDRELQALYGIAQADATARMAFDSGGVTVTFEGNFPGQEEGGEDSGEDSKHAASNASVSGSVATGYQSSASRMTRALGVTATVTQLQTEVARLKIKFIHVAHENNKDFQKLLKSLGGSVFKINEPVAMLFYWMNCLIPGGGDTNVSNTFRDSRGSIKYDTYSNGSNLHGAILECPHAALKKLATKRPDLPKAFDMMMGDIALTVCEKMYGRHGIPNSYFHYVDNDPVMQLKFCYEFSTCVTVKHIPQAPFTDTNRSKEKCELFVLTMPFQNSGSFMQVWDDAEKKKDPIGRVEGKVVWIPKERVLVLPGSVAKGEGFLADRKGHLRGHAYLWIGVDINPTSKQEIHRKQDHIYLQSRYMQCEDMVGVTPPDQHIGYRQHSKYNFVDNKRLFIRTATPQADVTTDVDNETNQPTRTNLRKKKEKSRKPISLLYKRITPSQKFGNRLFGLINTDWGYADVPNTPVQNFEKKEKRVSDLKNRSPYTNPTQHEGGDARTTRRLRSLLIPDREAEKKNEVRTTGGTGAIAGIKNKSKNTNRKVAKVAAVRVPVQEALAGSRNRKSDNSLDAERKKKKANTATTDETEPSKKKKKRAPTSAHYHAVVVLNSIKKKCENKVGGQLVWVAAQEFIRAFIEGHKSSPDFRKLSVRNICDALIFLIDHRHLNAVDFRVGADGSVQLTFVLLETNMDKAQKEKKKYALEIKKRGQEERTMLVTAVSTLATQLDADGLFGIVEPVGGTGVAATAATEMEKISGTTDVEPTTTGGTTEMEKISGATDGNVDGKTIRSAIAKGGTKPPAGMSAAEKVSGTADDNDDEIFYEAAGEQDGSPGQTVHDNTTQSLSLEEGIDMVQSFLANRPNVGFGLMDIITGVIEMASTQGGIGYGIALASANALFQKATSGNPETKHGPVKFTDEGKTMITIRKVTRKQKKGGK